MARPADETLIGRTIAGKFSIESFIGGGAMGQVYRARQIALEKTVAVKVMHRDLLADETFATRFHREAKAASRLDHPNSLRVIDFGAEPDGLLYIAMEFLDGRDLLKLNFEEWPLSGERIARILMQALAALAVAHDMGVVHRDLKPENIMILRGTNDEGQSADIVKVCDFGIAKITARVPGKDSNPPSARAASAPAGMKGPSTTEGLVVGTPEYMSPEQGKGEPLDLRTDLYAIGVILFQLLTGRVPFEAETALGVVLKHVTEEPPKPSSIKAAIDPRLEAICLKAMRKNRGERYQSAREMRTDLRAVLEGVMPPALVSGNDVVAPSSEPMAHAPTLRAHASELDPAGEGSGDGGPSEGAAPRTTAKGTLSGTMALPDLPIERPKWIPFALIVLLMTLVGVVLGVSIMGKGHGEPAGDETKVQGRGPLLRLRPRRRRRRGVRAHAPSAQRRIPRRSSRPLLRSSSPRLRRSVERPRLRLVKRRPRRPRQRRPLLWGPQRSTSSRRRPR